MGPCMQVYEPCIRTDDTGNTTDRCMYDPSLDLPPDAELPETVRRAVLEGLGKERGRRLMAEGKSVHACNVCTRHSMSACS